MDKYYGFVDIPPMIHAVVFALLAGYASSTSYPALAGVSLGVAIFLTLLYLVVDYQQSATMKYYNQACFQTAAAPCAFKKLMALVV